jgi:hypothetical protein
MLKMLSRSMSMSRGVLLLGAIWLLAACAPAAELALEDVVDAASPAPALVSPAATAVPATATAVAPPTFTPIPTSAPTPTPEIGFYPPPGREFATLDEFWNGRAEWLLEIWDVGLPLGESDSVQVGEFEFWSYLHASHQSAGVVDQCGDPVPFPGCTTLWRSTDAGRSFSLEEPVCLFPCAACPCDNRRDHIAQQQYPRVAQAEDGAWYLVYEFGAYNYLRTSADGLTWSGHAHIPGTWIWTFPYGPCAPYELIGRHPNIFAELEWDCLAGGPPGIYVAGDELYVFVALGKAPGHMGCYRGDRRAGAAAMRECANNPLFGAELGYGPVDLTGAAANPYFEFRTISSADVVRLGERYYMVYEGVRGPSDPTVVDDQFALGLARSVGLAIDGSWEKYPENPIIMDLPGNVGLGHADLALVGEATYLYTTTSDTTRGRYVLVKK